MFDFKFYKTKLFDKYILFSCFRDLTKQPNAYFIWTFEKFIFFYKHFHFERSGTCLGIEFDIRFQYKSIQVCFTAFDNFAGREGTVDWRLPWYPKFYCNAVDHSLAENFGYFRKSLILFSSYFSSIKEAIGDVHQFIIQCLIP